MARKQWCSVCKGFASATARWQNGSIRTCKFINKDILSTKAISKCDHFDLYPFVWCQHNNGRFSVEICRLASKEHCASCEIGSMVREVLPSAPLTFQPGDVNGLSNALQKLRERLDAEEKNGNGAKPKEPQVVFKRRRAVAAPEKPKPTPKRRRPIIIRTPKNQG